MDARRTIRLAVALAILCLGQSASAQVTASGSINSTLINNSGISLVFATDGSGVTLSGAGSNAATLNFGPVSMFMTTPPGVTLTRTANDFTISSYFDVVVQQGGMTRPSYNLQASLQSTPGVYTYKIDGVTLPLAPSTATIAANASYGTTSHTVSLTIPATARAGVVSNTMNFLATSN